MLETQRGIKQISIAFFIVLVCSVGIFGQSDIQRAGIVLLAEVQRLNGQVKENNKCEMWSKSVVLLTSYGILKENPESEGLPAIVAQILDYQNKLKNECKSGNVSVSPVGNGFSVRVGPKTIFVKGREVDLVTLALLYLDEDERNLVIKEVSISDQKLAAELKTKLELNKDLTPALQPDLNIIRQEQNKKIINEYLQQQIKSLQNPAIKLNTDLQQPNIRQQKVIKPNKP